MKNQYIPRFTHFTFFALFFTFFLISTSLIAQVGIGTEDPKTTLDVDGGLSLREGPALVLSNGNNGIDLGTTPYSQYRITGPTAAFSINDITAVNGLNGQVVTFYNTTNFPMTIVNSTPTASKGIFNPGEDDLVLIGKYASITLQYNFTESRWFVVTYSDKSDPYGENVIAKKGTSNISKSGSTFSDMADMKVTFTPRHAIVYVTFSVAGGVNGIFTFATAKFRIIKDNAVVGGTQTTITASPWSTGIAMFPVSVTPGLPTTLNIQWQRDGAGTIDCTPATSPESNHRSLTVFD